MNRLKLVPRPCDARFPSYGPPHLTKRPTPRGLTGLNQCVYVIELVMGFNLRGYTFLCDQGFGSYGLNKFWINTLSTGGYSGRKISARALGPAGAYSTAPHMTSEVMLSAFSTGSLSSCYPRFPQPQGTTCDL